MITKQLVCQTLCVLVDLITRASKRMTGLRRVIRVKIHSINTHKAGGLLKRQVGCLRVLASYWLAPETPDPRASYELLS
jgi:hypothetical protein